MQTLLPVATKVTRPVLIGVLLALSGCYSLSRNAPLQQHYVLGASERTENATSAVRTPSILVIGLRPPRLAGYLGTPYIVVRKGVHQVRFSEFDRWGEDLARGINRTVAGHMVARSPSHRVEAAPWPPGDRPDVLIQLHVLRFEGVAPEDPQTMEGEAHVQVAWEILRPEGGALLGRGLTEVRANGWTVGDFDGLVSLLDRGLATLAADLVLALESSPAP